MISAALDIGTLSVALSADAPAVAANQNRFDQNGLGQNGLGQNGGANVAATGSVSSGLVRV